MFIFSWIKSEQCFIHKRLCLFLWPWGNSCDFLFRLFFLTQIIYNDKIFYFVHAFYQSLTKILRKIEKYFFLCLYEKSKKKVYIKLKIYKFFILFIIILIGKSEDWLFNDNQCFSKGKLSVRKNIVEIYGNLFETNTWTRYMNFYRATLNDFYQRSHLR